MYEYVGADDWTRSSVYGLGHWKNGLAFKTEDFSETGRPIIKIAELKGGITPQTARTLGAYDPAALVRPGDMLFAWSGNPDTSIDVFRWAGEEGWLNQHIFKVTPAENVSWEFLFFMLRWLRPRFAEIARNKQTTGLGHVTVQDLKRMTVGVPSMTEQAEIIRVIGPIQEKIELNAETCALIETIVRETYRDWFVDFGPTRAKIEQTAPYLAEEIWSLFPDAFDAEGRPFGWADGSLEDVARQVGSSINPESLDANTPYIGLEHMPRRSMALGNWGNANNVSSGKTSFKKGDLLFGKLRPYFHKVGIAPVDGICSTDIVVVNAKSEIPYSFVAACINQDDFVAFTDRTSDGTKMPRTSWKRMEQYPVCVPNVEVMTAFDALAGSMLDWLVSAVHETRALVETLGLILPELMSGALRLREHVQTLRGGK